LAVNNEKESNNIQRELVLLIFLEENTCQGIRMRLNVGVLPEFSRLKKNIF
jgi:hypothetical protein